MSSDAPGPSGGQDTVVSVHGTVPDNTEASRRILNASRRGFRRTGGGTENSNGIHRPPGTRGIPLDQGAV